MASLKTCGQYGCRKRLENDGDIYCKDCGGRDRAVAERLVPKEKPKLCHDKRGVVPPKKGYAGTKPNPMIRAEKEQAAAEEKRRLIEARRNRPKKQKKSGDEGGKKNKKKQDKDSKKAKKKAAKQ